MQMTHPVGSMDRIRLVMLYRYCHFVYLLTKSFSHESVTDAKRQNSRLKKIFFLSFWRTQDLIYVASNRNGETLLY